MVSPIKLEKMKAFIDCPNRFVTPERSHKMEMRVSQNDLSNADLSALFFAQHACHKACP